MMGMSEKPIQSYGKGFLVLLLPISFLVIFLVTTWRIWLGLFLLIISLNLWQRYQWQRWCIQVNPIFHRLIQQNQGRLTPIDLAVIGNFPGDKAKRYLDTKASEFGANIADTQDGSKVYYFITASILGDILDSSEPAKDLNPKPLGQGIQQLLAPPEAKPHLEKPEVELFPQENQEEVKKPLEKQLVFGSLIQSELAKRLNVYSSTVYKRRDDPEFSEWSRSKDPDHIAWKFSQETKEFFPLEE